MKKINMTVVNIVLFILMLIFNCEIFSLLCMTVFAAQLLSWIFKHYPKNY